MKHANSNLNVLKKNTVPSKKTKNNNFLKPPMSSNNKNYININKAQSKNTNNNILINLLYKDKSKISLYSNLMQKYKNETSHEKNANCLYSFNNQMNNINKNLNNNYSFSLSNSLNYKAEKENRGHINIRLNLNNEIINNNFTQQSKSKHKSLNINMIEKIKEKDCLITKLQKDLLQSQELLHKLQKDKQKELSFTYNSVKSFDNLNNLSKDIYQQKDFFTQTSEKEDKITKTNIIKFNVNNKKINANFSNHKIKKNKKKLKSNFKNSLSGICSNKKRYHSPKSNNHLKCFSSSPNKCHSHGMEQYDFCISLSKYNLRKKTGIKSEIIKSDFRSNYNYKTTRTKYPLPTNVIINEKKNSLISFSEIKDKCKKLKEKTNKVLVNYLLLIDYYRCINKKKLKK